MKKRIPVIAGNWKMYKTKDEALAFIYAVNLKVPERDVVETVICAPSVLLYTLMKREGENLKIGAQNMHYLEEGAYTGETSPLMLKSINIEYTVIGHSERRAYYNETDESVNKKVLASIKHDITPIVCVGESLEIREAEKTDEFVANQIEKAYQNVDANDVTKTIIAYEPIWAIGTGKTASPDQANDAIKSIRALIEKLYNKDVADKVRILYGGSVNTKNVDELLAKSDIDGALVGGASLDVDSYLYLVNAAVKK